MSKSNPTPHRDLELQDELNYVRSLRTHHVGLSFHMVKKFDALDRLEQLGHKIALVRARSRAEHYDSPVWKDYNAALEMVKAIDREEERLWQALLAFRGSKLLEETTSTSDCAAGRGQPASKDTATEEADNAVQLSKTSVDRSHIEQGAQTALATGPSSTTPQTCSASIAHDTSASPAAQLANAQVRDYWLSVNRTATTNNEIQPEPCTVPVPAADRVDSLHKGMSYLLKTYRVLYQTLFALCLLCLCHASWCFEPLVLGPIFAVDWSLPVKTPTVFDVVVCIAVELVKDACFRR